ncbi:hypothetical protein BC628DRAFT_573948 [Trametes gibbosa]|nr:hypothetical protein BC628DRAFT_573948 [Trametes gibbosa]
MAWRAWRLGRGGRSGRTPANACQRLPTPAPSHPLQLAVCTARLGHWQATEASERGNAVCAQPTFPWRPCPYIIYAHAQSTLPLTQARAHLDATPSLASKHYRNVVRTRVDPVRHGRILGLSQHITAGITETQRSRTRVGHRVTFLRASSAKEHSAIPAV